MKARQIFPLLIASLQRAALPLAVLQPFMSGSVAEAASITSYAPPNLAQGVSPLTALVVHFSDAMDTNLTSATMVNAQAFLVPLPTQQVWSLDSKTLTCTPSPALPSNATIIWSVEGYDLLGDPLEGNPGGMFVTGVGGPSLLSSSPTNMAVDVPPTTFVVFTFSTRMNTNTTFTMFRDTTTQALLPMVSNWSADQIQLTCSPVSPFPPGRTILWNIAGEDIAGKTLSGASGIFTTKQGTPALLYVSPTNGALNVPPFSPVVFTFANPMDSTATIAEFRDAAVPGIVLPTSNFWTVDFLKLVCTPKAAFPAQARINWIIRGKELTGTILAETNGMYFTSSSTTVPASPALLSHGELIQQLDATTTTVVGHEMFALAGGMLTNGATVTPPGATKPSFLHNTGAATWLCFRDAVAEPGAFEQSYPPGLYEFAAFMQTGAQSASLALSRTDLPKCPRINNWQQVPFVLMGEPYTFSWSLSGAGAEVNYVRVSVHENGKTTYATPLPGELGALTGLSNQITIPGAVFRTLAVRKIELTAFAIRAEDTNSIPGVSLTAATHRTTSFPLRVANASTPLPSLQNAIMHGVPAGEPFLNPLIAANGIRPLKFELASGDLPPGLVLQSDGLLIGQSLGLGSFNCTVKITDLVGRAVTQPLTIVTVPPSLGSIPTIQVMQYRAADGLVLDVFAPFAGTCFIERSMNLSDWTTQLSTNLTAGRTSIKVATSPGTSFYRLSAPGVPVPKPRPVKVTPILNPAVSTTGVVDARGGLLRLTNSLGIVFSFTVPPGALDRSETISMTEIASIRDLPLSEGLKAAVDFKPDGLMFNLPARLDIVGPPNTDARLWMGFSSRADGSQFALQPAFSITNGCSLYLWHFSPAGAGTGTAGDAASQAQNGTEDPMTSLTQQAAAALQSCKADPDCDMTSKTEELTRIYIAMADHIVIPNLKQAAADDSRLDAALNRWLRWLKEIALLNLYEGDFFGNGQPGELQKRVRQAGSLAATAIKNGMDSACQQCMQHEVFRIYRMMELARISELIGLNNSATFWSCVEKCLVFELTLESEFMSVEGGTIMNTHTKAKAKLKPGLNDDTSPDPVLALMMKMSGSGQWNVTAMQHTTPPKCSILTAPQPGRFEVPLAMVSLYKKRQVWVPGTGPVTTYAFDPDFTAFISAGLDLMPKEKRMLCCPPASPVEISDIFGHMFHAFHNDEAVLPENGSIDEVVLQGPAFRMTGFTTGGPSEVIFSKPYFRTIEDTTENTLIELRHTPGQ